MCGASFPAISDPKASAEERFKDFKGFVKAVVDGLSPKEIEQINVDYYAENIVSPGRLWWYQTCTEFGYWQIAEPEGTAGGSVYTRLNTVQSNRNNCAKLFGVENSIPKVKEVLEYYGGGIFNQDRILWVNGMV
jgi:hypothetical protein